MVGLIIASGIRNRGSTINTTRKVGPCGVVDDSCCWHPFASCGRLDLHRVRIRGRIIIMPLLNKHTKVSVWQLAMSDLHSMSGYIGKSDSKKQRQLVLYHHLFVWSIPDDSIESSVWVC
jgi:hypothetical protein